MNRPLTLTAVLVGGILPAAAQSRTGPEIGAPIPEFQLRDHQGKTRRFEDLRGPKGLVLAFTRSADW